MVEARDDDRGTIILGWLTKVTVALVLVAVAGFEVLSIATTRVGVKDQAAVAADAAITSYASNANQLQAYDEAQASVEPDGGQIVRSSFRILPDGGVSFTMTQTATTLVLWRIPALAKLAVVRTHVVVHPDAPTGT